MNGVMMNSKEWRKNIIHMSPTDGEAPLLAEFAKATPMDPNEHPWYERGLPDPEVAPGLELIGETSGVDSRMIPVLYCSTLGRSCPLMEN